MVTSYRNTQLRQVYEKVMAGEGGDDPANKIKLSMKSNRVADTFRSLGNKFYLDGFYVNAIDEYNKSLCFSQLDGDLFNLSLAYANRADALLAMESHAECLKSIELALAANYPVNLRPRLLLMQSRCKDQLQAQPQERIKYRFRLSYPPDERIPFMVKGLQLRKSERFGRYVATVRDLNVGDVIMIEEPYIVTLQPEMRYKRCGHCMTGEKRHTLVPCQGCTNAMYCSERCRKEAWHVYHRYECVISEHVNQLDEFVGLALRSMLVGRSIYGTLEKYQDFLMNFVDSGVNGFDLDYTKLDRRIQFLAFHNMHFQDSHLPIPDRSAWMKKVAELLRLLQKADVFEGEKWTRTTEDFVLELLYRYTITNILNCYETSTSLPTRFNKVGISVSQYITMGLVNHSCAPNVQRVQQSNRQIMMVVRPIRKGEQLFDNYGPIFPLMAKKQRQVTLLNQYGFKCGCDACENDYPVVKRLKAAKGLEDINTLNAGGSVANQTNTSLEGRLNRADKLCQFLQKYDKTYPCLQVLEADWELYEIYSSLADEGQWEHRFKDFFKQKSPSKFIRWEKIFRKLDLL